MEKKYHFLYRESIIFFILQFKIVKIMKLTCLLLLLSVSLAFASQSYAQKAIISLNITNKAVVDVLDEIEAQTDFQFFYNNKIIDVNRKVSVDAKDSNVFAILKQIFENTDVVYKVVDNDIILALSETSDIFQEKRKITGVVTDQKTGETIIGANVLVKGSSTNGTVTDMEGRFSLEVSDDNILVVSYIGYKTKEIVVKSNSVFEIKIEEDSESLDEVVVVGYGTQKKVNLTGSVSALNTKDIEKLKVTQTSQLLAGMVSGINVTQGSG